ncbi:MAG: phosphoribosylformylglycinamidine cyclo-ligase [Defluviitaleaceae bacterium]|nr:phosphoribosylformylglycinamidine cyclo-ligase [Defluviitaleaceae bacterium]
MSFDYKSAGVDVEAGYKSVELMKEHVKKTLRPEVIGGLGGFGGMFSIKKAKDMEEPVLVSGTDGIGTKLKIAFLMDKHDTVGIDCVAMCVNDIICVGAEPLYFLDYIACDKNVPEKIADIVKGIADGCVMSNASLIGGETAEMPGLYHDGEYDVAGFAVGIVDKKDMIDGSQIKAGDDLVGIKSSGLHSNGYSLVRKVLNPSESNINEYVESLGCTLGEELLKPTKIFVKPVLEVIKKVNVKGISNITGGGFIENIPRMLPENSGLGINIFDGVFDVSPIFKLIEEKGSISRENMYKTFNMGIGMVMAVSEEDSVKLMEELKLLGEEAYIIGKVRKGSGIDIC